MKNKICVYSCITGNYDDVKEIRNKERGIDYFLFTNNKKIKSSTWNVVYIEDNKLSDAQLARKTKIMGNDIVNNYDIALWMDGSITFDKKVKDFIKTYLSENDAFAGFKHCCRNNILEECDACVRYRKENNENIEKLLSFYDKENYKFDNGLIESTVYIKRPKNKQVIKTMKLWFDMILNYSIRDQLSFNYVISKTGLKVNWIEKNIWNNEWFHANTHNSNKLVSKARIYYGDEDKEFDRICNEEIDYKIDKNVYSFQTLIKEDTNIIKIEVTNEVVYNFDDLVISGIKSESIKYFNYINYNNQNYFIDKGYVYLKGNYKKGDKIQFKIKLKPVSDYEKNDLIVILFYNKINLENRINDLEIANKNAETYINNIINSKSWKITKPIRNISEKIKKKKKNI